MEKTVFDLMRRSYNDAAAPLVERRKACEERSAKRLLIAGQIEALQAKGRLLRFDLDKALSEGMATRASELKSEIASYQEQIAALETESAGLLAENAEESATLDAAFKNLAARTLQENYPKVREITIAKVRECIEFIEQAWQDLLTYEKATAPCLSINLHRTRLVPSDILTDADEKKLADAAEFWFGAGNGRPLKKQ